jgi:hypothetical protein
MKTDMGTDTVCVASSIAEAAHIVLAGHDSCLCIRHTASADIASLLLAKASQIKAGGEQVFLVCADDAAASRYRRQLPAFVGLADEDIITMRGLCARVFARAAIPEFSGTLRQGLRVLDDNEHDMVLEDLKTSGVRSRRLREMLKFFYRSLSQYADEDWLLTAEERAVFALLRENLKMRRAVLPCEIASKACRVLHESDVRAENIVAAGVAIVDGYDTLSGTSQHLLDLLFPDRLIVAGSMPSAQSPAEPYPHPEGFLSFCETHADALRIELAIDQPPADMTCETYSDPAAEFAGVTSAVVNCLATGVLPRDILVAVPNLVWGRRIAALLAQRGVEVALDEGSLRIEGDPRRSERCGRLRLAAFFRLFLDPGDFVSLRSWLGFGDWLLRSDAFLDLMAFAQGQGLDMGTALAVLRGLPSAQRPFESFEKLEGPLEELDELRRACADISREDAVMLFARYGMTLDRRMVGLLGPDPDHADVRGLARHAFVAPPFLGGASDAADVTGDSSSAYPDDSDALIIAPYRRCCGRHVRVTFLTGCINGFLPSLDAVDDRYTIDHRNRALGRERQLFEAVRATASEMLVCSHFQNDRAENAEALNMQAIRLFIKGDVRYAKMAPSAFLASAG